MDVYRASTQDASGGGVEDCILFGVNRALVFEFPVVEDIFPVFHAARKAVESGGNNGSIRACDDGAAFGGRILAPCGNQPRHFHKPGVPFVHSATMYQNFKMSNETECRDCTQRKESGKSAGIIQGDAESRNRVPDEIRLKPLTQNKTPPRLKPNGQATRPLPQARAGTGAPARQ